MNTATATDDLSNFTRSIRLVPQATAHVKYCNVQSMHVKTNWLKYAKYEVIALKTVKFTIGHVMTADNRNF